MDKIGDSLQFVARQINALFANREPWQIATITATTVLTTVWFWEFVNQDESMRFIHFPLTTFIILIAYLIKLGIVNRTKKKFYKLARNIPAVQSKINKELDKMTTSLQEDSLKRTAGVEYFTKLPYDAFNGKEILELIDRYLALGDYNWKGGRVSGAVYNYDTALADLVADVYRKTSYTNPLHPDIFPGICKMEAEVVRMTATLFRGGPETAGTVRVYCFSSLSKFFFASNTSIIHKFYRIADDNWRNRINYDGL